MAKQKKPIKEVPKTTSRYIHPPEKKVPGVRTPIDKRRAGEHYDSVFHDDLNNSLEDMSDYIHGRFKDET